MPNENKFEYGNPQPHVVIPVLHPDSNEIHNIAVPTDTDLGELHKSLSDAGYEHPGITAAEAGPTEEGTLERSQVFRDAAKKAWETVGNGDLPQEAGFMVRNNGSPTPIQVGKEIGSTETTGSTTFHIPAEGVFGTLHTHPKPSMTKHWIQQPSQPDIDVARNNHENVYVVTTSGLWQVDKNGTVNHIYDSNDWTKSDYKSPADESAAFNKGINPDGYTIRVTLKGGKEVTVPAGNGDYPLAQMQELKKNGMKGVDPKDIKAVQTFGKGELKPKQ